ncbi:MAG: LamG-like jellyroll fold domain-containing protein [Anaerolineales bacterium]
MHNRLYGSLLAVFVVVAGCAPSAPLGQAPTFAPPTVTTGVSEPPTGYPAAPTLPATNTPASYPAPSAAPGATSTLAPTTAPAASGGAGFALRFFGTGQGDADRVKIPLDTQADIGAGDFTLEFWLKAAPGENASASAGCGSTDGWITGNIVFDRDIWDAGDFGDYGLSLASGRVVFGLAQGKTGTTICGTTDVADGQWHHVAVTRAGATGQVQMFVDGRLDAEGEGPTGDVSYRDGRAAARANDPFLVFGAEKHDYDPSQYPSFRGWLDEVRLSTIIRYTGDFDRPTTPFQSDEATAALWHFDEGAGETLIDSAPGGASLGQVKVGGPNNGPQWTMSDAPLIARR